MSPRQPHLFARGVEGHRQPREDAVARTERLALHEQAPLGLDEGRRRSVRHRDALGNARRTRGEDDPGIVADGRRGHHRQCVRAGVRRVTVVEAHESGIRIRRDELAVARDDAPHPRLTEDQARALIGVVGVDRHVRRPRGHDGEDRHVQLLRARGHAHAHAIPAPHARLVQRRRGTPHPREQFAVAQRPRAVVDGGCLGMPCGDVGEDVDQRARGRRSGQPVERSLGGGSGGRHGTKGTTPRETPRTGRPGSPSVHPCNADS